MSKAVPQRTEDPIKRVGFDVLVSLCHKVRKGKYNFPSFYILPSLIADVPCNSATLEKQHLCTIHEKEDT